MHRPAPGAAPGQLSFVDADEEIVKAAGASVSEIFHATVKRRSATANAG